MIGMMKASFAALVAIVYAAGAGPAQAEYAPKAPEKRGASDAPTAVSAPASDVSALVERLGRVGRSTGATFSPDGKQIALISDLSGVPQIWIVPAEGGWPRLVTSGNEPIRRGRKSAVEVTRVRQCRSGTE